MKNIIFYTYSLLAFVLCAIPILFLSSILVKNIQESESIFKKCSEEKSQYLDSKDCVLCCQQYTEFKMELQPIKRDIISSGNLFINLVVANFHGICGPVFLFFLCPAIQLIIGLSRRDKFYIATGFSSLALLYVGLITVVIYSFATWDGS